MRKDDTYHLGLHTIDNGLNLIFELRFTISWASSIWVSYVFMNNYCKIILENDVMVCRPSWEGGGGGSSLPCNWGDFKLKASLHSNDLYTKDDIYISIQSSLGKSEVIYTSHIEGC